MSKVFPELMIFDDVDGPGLRIAQWCPLCRIFVTDRALDVSTFQPPYPGAAWGVEDGSAWLAHVKEKKH